MQTDVPLDAEQIHEGARRLSGAGSTTNAQADGVSALGVATAILLGLTARDRLGVGQEVFASMLNTNTHAMSAQAVRWDGAPDGPVVAADLQGVGARYRIYPAADGWVFLAAPTAREWDALVAECADLVDLESAADDAALQSLLERTFATRPARTWEKVLVDAGVPCVAVETASIESVLFSEPYSVASGYAVAVVHPIFDDHLRLAPFVRFSRSATRALPGVLAGEATDRVLTELGREVDEIADLRARGVVR